ncbi:hypothetical protein R69746_04397 [Paraburkholderia aspalathi]|uniref:hypothetical protein n=1 Tax=Paraburkholderia aspalathi TaxID=1324617 RepID=UPI00190C604A|nr:hypothetical protein [Paraburkholderia aspalathi]MBK3840522.1 hypothetical protein [Paraburkholderia aspalathi]CAE6783485.1 hypothetical protein R69746_04397 [Paraburkholderia aspalathi]
MNDLDHQEAGRNGWATGQESNHFYQMGQMDRFRAQQAESMARNLESAQADLVVARARARATAGPTAGTGARTSQRTYFCNVIGVLTAIVFGIVTYVQSPTDYGLIAGHAFAGGVVGVMAAYLITSVWFWCAAVAVAVAFYYFHTH